MNIAHVTLTVTQGMLSGTEYRFNDRAQCTVGRAVDCDIQLPSDWLHFDVSRHHCAFEIEPPDVRVRDLGSLNGTFVNGQRIGQRSAWQPPPDSNVRQFSDYGLKDGDCVKVGGTVLEIGVGDDLGEVGRRVAQANHVLLCLDFDGALTPFVEDPAAAYPSPSMQRVLRSLSDHDNVSLAVISGRERADLVQHVGIPGLIYAGNHGLEISGPGCVFVEATAAARSEIVKEVAQELAKRLRPVRGVIVEDKGLTLCVHYRLASEADREHIESTVRAAMTPYSRQLEIISGEKALEIRPRVNWNLGATVDWILQQVQHPDACVVYVGDDANEREWRNPETSSALRDGVTIKVSESIHPLAEQELQGPGEVRRFLETVERLVRLHDRQVPATQGKA